VARQVWSRKEKQGPETGHDIQRPVTSAARPGRLNQKAAILSLKQIPSVRVSRTIRYVCVEETILNFSNLCHHCALVQ